MVQMRQVVQDLQKGKEVTKNLHLFKDAMLTYGKRFAMTRTSLNYPSHRDLVSDSMEMMYFSDKLVQSINDVNYVIDHLHEERIDLDKAEKIRATVKENMETITGLADHFIVLEYILNRIEYRHKPIPDRFLDADKCRKIIIYLIERARGSEYGSFGQWMYILEQLPVRMTKERFYQRLRDGMHLYVGGDKKSFSELIYSIRTTAVMNDKKEWEEEYPESYRFMKELEAVDYYALDKMGYITYHANLQHQLKELDRFIHVLQLLQQLANDIYAIHLAESEGVGSVPEEEIYYSIAAKLYGLPDEKLGKTIRELHDEFVKLEGIQEECYGQFLVGESVIDELLSAYGKEIDENNLRESFEKIKRVGILISNSAFADLEDEEGASDIIDEAYVNEHLETIIHDFEKLFEGKQKLAIRAMMAKALVCLPSFLDGRQVPQYIDDAFAACDDEAEKAASIEIISAYMCKYR